MRLHAPFALAALVTFAAGPARADHRARARAAHAADPRVTVVDDEPTSHQATTPPRAGMRGVDGDGQLRAVTLPTPTAGTVDDGAAAIVGNHDAPAPVAHDDDAPLMPADARAELAARQLRKETHRLQRAIDACTVAAVRRHPAAAGTVTLAFVVRERKVADVHVGADDVHDFALDQCLTQVARDFRFALDSASVTWPVALSPSAAR